MNTKKMQEKCRQAGYEMRREHYARLGGRGLADGYRWRITKLADGRTVCINSNPRAAYGYWMDYVNNPAAR
jgi:hypothetical protein